MLRFDDYMKYGPFICIGVVLAVLFVLWAFWGGKNYEFVGLAPLSPDTCGSYTGSIYNWGNITPAAGYNPIEGQSCVPPDGACVQEDARTKQPIILDYTPPIAAEFLDNSVKSICEPEPDVQIETPVQNTSQNAPQNIIRPVTSNNRGRFISRGERLCCQTMEKIYGVPFTTVRPKWLRNYTGMPLELDCYNADLQLAVEYNGEQHYKWPNFTNQTYEQFLAQVERDARKVELCDRNGVYLIVVPYHVAHDNIPDYIMSYLPETIQKRLHDENILSDLNNEIEA